MVLEELNEARARYDRVCGLLRSSIIFDSFMQLSSLAGSKQEQYLPSCQRYEKGRGSNERLRGTIHKMEEAASLSRNELIELLSQRAAADRSIKGFERQLASKEKVSVRCLNSFFSLFIFRKSLRLEQSPRILHLCKKRWNQHSPRPNSPMLI